MQVAKPSDSNEMTNYIRLQRQRYVPASGEGRKITYPPEAAR
jgi:hypothetical protein